MRGVSYANGTPQRLISRSLPMIGWLLVVAAVTGWLVLAVYRGSGAGMLVTSAALLGLLAVPFARMRKSSMPDTRGVGSSELNGRRAPVIRD